MAAYELDQVCKGVAAASLVPDDDGLGERTGHPRLVTSSAQSYDVALQRRLWAASEELTGVSFPA